MASIFHEAILDTSLEAAWDFLERYSRSEVHVFSMSASERQEGDFRVVTLHDGSEVWERIITVDPERLRSSYTVPGLNQAELHHAEMRLEVGPGGAPALIWVTDFVPASIVKEHAPVYEKLFAELVAATNAHVVA